MATDSETITYSFKDNFSYFAAFLAVLVGLLAFKKELEAISLHIIDWDLSILVLTLPFIICMIIAMYVGALAMQSKTITFTLFPLTRILEWTASAFAWIGLSYPIVVLLAYFLTLLSNLIPDFLSPSNSEVINIIISTLTSIFVAITGIKASNSRLNDHYKRRSNELLVEYSQLANKSHAANTMDILLQYNHLTNLAKWMLRLKGYSAIGDHLPNISKKLVSLGILNKTDHAKVEDIRGIRNRIAHGTQLPTPDEIKNVNKIIDELAEKLRNTLVQETQAS